MPGRARLGRTRALLRELGDPQLAVRGALVAGTNGKGSVLALAGAALRAAGHRVAETPKPHLVTYRERLQLAARELAAEYDQLKLEAQRRLGSLFDASDYPTTLDGMFDMEWSVVPVEPLALGPMEYPKRWPAENWTLAFQGNVHELSDADAELLEAAVRAAGPVAVGR